MNDKKAKLAFIGLGLRSFTFLSALQNIKEKCELVALCDLSAKRMEHVTKRYRLKGVRCYTDYRTCIMQSECNAVMIFTPDGRHADPTIAALEAGKHVFLEKPLEITETGCHSIIAADDAAGGRTYVGFNLRHAPVYRKIKELIESGITGPLLTIQADEFYDGGRTYFRRWNRLRELSGGLWVTKACHDFDLLQWLAGSTPVSISAHSALTYYKAKPEATLHCSECQLETDCPDAFDRYTSEEIKTFQLAAVEDGFPRPDLCLYNSDKDTFDHGQTLIRFAGGLHATYTVNVVSGFTNRRIRVSGTRAVVDGDLASQEIIIRHRDPSRTERFIASETTDGHGGADKYLLPDFLAFVRGEKPTPVSPREALLSVRMGLAARNSSDSGGTVTLV